MIALDVATHLMENNIGVNHQPMALFSSKNGVPFEPCSRQDSSITWETGAQVTCGVTTWNVIPDITLSEDCKSVCDRKVFQLTSKDFTSGSLLEKFSLTQREIRPGALEDGDRWVGAGGPGEIDDGCHLDGWAVWNAKNSGTE